MNNLYKYKKSIILMVIVGFFSIYFTNSFYGNECSDFKKELIKTTLRGINKDSGDEAYYSAMGRVIQRLHEEKKIDIMCRPFLLTELRKIIRGNSGSPTGQELAYYDFYSEYSRQLIEADIQIGRTFFKEKIQYKDLDRFAKKMHEASRKVKINPDNIPNTLHHIWLTHPDKPREILSGDIRTVLMNKELFSKDPVKWRHIVWTNDKTLIPSSIKKLEENGIEVISIQDYRDDIALYDLIENLIDVQLFGAASDILRYSILNYAGGVYADLNFKFNRGIYETLRKYDFLLQDTRNNFFASKPSHVILQKTLEKIEQVSENVVTDSNISTIGYTHHPFVLEILKNANVDQNVDFYLDYYYFYDKNDPGPVGEDNYSSSGTWQHLGDLK